MTKRILFRADAKQSIGTGDLVSLIHLSRYFENDGWQSHFIIRDYDASVEIVRKNKIKSYLIIKEPYLIGKETKEINNYIESRGSMWSSLK